MTDVDGDGALGEYKGARGGDIATGVVSPGSRERMRSAGENAGSAAARLGERLRLLGISFGPLVRPVRQVDRNGLLIEQYFQCADVMGVPRGRAMEILRGELWTLGRPMADRVRAATERLSREEP